MSDATPILRRFANRLMEYESSANHPSLTKPASVLPVIDKLRPLLTVFMGRAGYHALVSRALLLAQTETDCLCEFEIDADASLIDHSKFSVEQEDDKRSDGDEIVIAHLIGLLVAFIGEGMTLRLLHEPWPDLPSNINFSKRNEHE